MIECLNVLLVAQDLFWVSSKVQGLVSLIPGVNIARRAQANQKQLAVAHSSVDALNR